jgi:uncharacterized membrane protein
MTFALLLVLIGLLFLLRNLGLVVISWSIIWPIILIGVGLYIAVVSRKVSGWCRSSWKKVLRKLE